MTGSVFEPPAAVQRSRQEFQNAWRKSARRKVKIIMGGGVFSAPTSVRSTRRGEGREAGKRTIF